MLTVERLGELRTPIGERLLAVASQLEEDPFAVEKLRRRELVDLELAAAAVDQVRLRRRAALRFPRSAEMWFTRPLLEQASGTVISQYRAIRFLPWTEPGDWVGDLCCGLGGDTLALAAVTWVVAIDQDPLALALTGANLQALGLLDRVRRVCGPLPGAAPRVRAAWVDPGRREGGRRTRRLDAASPPLASILSLREQIPHLGIKLSPAADDEELARTLGGVPHEREFISLAGECRELVLWTGDLRKGETEAAAKPLHRATVLPAGAELAGRPASWREAGPSRGWLLEPDPAVIRAGLVGNLAEQLEAWPVDGRLAYLATSGPVVTPLGSCYRIEKPEPFSERALAERLRGLEAGEVTLKTRGTVLQPEMLRARLRGVLKQGRPDRHPVVFLTRLAGRAMMILGERIGPER